MAVTNERHEISPGRRVESPMRGADIPVQELWPPREVSRLEGLWTSTKAITKGNAGLLLVAASQAFLSLMNVSVKQLNSIDPPVSALQLVNVRMVITWLCCVGYMTWMKVPDPLLGPKGVRMLLVFRGFSGFFGLFGIYYSLQYLSLSDATVLTFLAPMCTAVAGALFLGETFSRKQAFAGLVSLIGVVLIARPASLFGTRKDTPLKVKVPDDGGLQLPVHGPRIVTPAERLLAVGVALFGVLGATGACKYSASNIESTGSSSFVDTSIRAIGKRAHPLHALTSFAIQCIVVSSTAMFATKEKYIIPDKIEWLGLFLLIGTFGFVAQILLTMGLQRETAGRGSMAIYTQIVFATVFEWVFFHALPSLLSALGTALILSSAIYVALLKKAETPAMKAEGNPVPLQRVSEENCLERGLLESYEDELLDDEDHHDGSELLADHESQRKDSKHAEDWDIALPLFSERA